MAPTDAHLLRLPNEILTTICTDLDKDDLTALRLVCKEVHGSATQAFAKRYLTDPYLMMTPYSLNTFVEICKHPLFGPHVRKVQFTSLRWTLAALERCTSDVQYSIRGGHLAEAKEAAANFKCLTDVISEEVGLMQSRQGLELLTKGLRAINANGKQISLAVVVCKMINPIGLRKVVGSDGLSSPLFRWCKQQIKSTLNMMLEAVLISGCQVEGLEVLAENFQYMDDETHVDIQETGPALISCLKTVDLEIHPAALHVSMQGLQRILSNAGNLTKFSFNSGILFESVVILEDAKNAARIIRFTNSKVLQDVCLEEIAIFQKTLMSLLNTPMLRTLKLRRVVIQGSWIDTLAWIRDHTSLTSFELHQGFTIDFAGYDRDEPTMWYADKIEFRGREEVRAGLDKFIEEQKKRQEEQEANDSADGDNSSEDE